MHVFDSIRRSSVDSHPCIRGCHQLGEAEKTLFQVSYSTLLADRSLGPSPWSRLGDQPMPIWIITPNSGLKAFSRSSLQLDTAWSQESSLFWVLHIYQSAWCIEDAQQNLFSQARWSPCLFPETSDEWWFIEDWCGISLLSIMIRPYNLGHKHCN